LTRRQDSDEYSEADEIVQSIVDVHHGIVSVAQASLRDVAPNVVYAEFGVLRLLAIQGSRRISDIFYELSMAPSTLTRYCDQLCRVGLMVRTRNARDRREVRIDLTPQGRELVESVVKRQQRDLAAYLSSLSASERASLLRITRKLVPVPRFEGGEADSQASVSAVASR
jgi:DNA-binding MarR family transcriptional regulator